MNAATPFLPVEVSTDWYRQPSVKLAFLLSLLVHAAAIALLPGVRVPAPSEPVPMLVELAPIIEAPPPPASEPKPVPKSVLQPPAPVPQPPPPALRQPPVQEKPPEPPAVIARVVPQPQAPPELRVPPQPEARPEPKPQPIPEPRVEAPPTPSQPRPEPPQARVEPPPPAVVAAAPQPAPDPALLKAYGGVLAQAIGRRKNYPRLARIRNWQGTAELKLQIGTDGTLKGLTVAHSSGYPVLDEQAITMVKETVPFPEVPDALRGREFAITVPVVFRLE